MCKSRSIQLSDWPLLNSIDTACKLQAKLEKVISSCKLTHTDIKTFSLPWGCSMTKLLGVRSWHITSTISALLALSEKTLQGFYMWQFDYTLGYHCEAHSQLHVCWLHDNLFLILSQLSFTLSYYYLVNCVHASNWFTLLQPTWQMDGQNDNSVLTVIYKNRIVILTIILSCLLQMGELIWCMDTVDSMIIWSRVGWEWGKDCHVVVLPIVTICVHSSESEIANCQSLWQCINVLHRSTREDIYIYITPIWGVLQ